MKKLLLLSAFAAGTFAVAQRTVTVQQGDLKLRFDTRVTFDGAVHMPSTDISGWKWGSDDFRLTNGANVTQARFGVWGSIGEKWKGKIDLKLVDGKVSLQDIFFDYILNSKGYIRAGYYVDPVSVEINAASSYLSIPSPMTLSLLAHPTRFLGLSYTNYSKHHYAVAGIYGSSLGAHRSLVNRVSDGWGITLKGAYLPINEDQNTIYLGAYARYRTPDISLTGKKDQLSFGTHTGSTIDGRSFVGGTLDNVRDYMLLGGELALTRGKLHLMGEYIANVVNFRSDAGRPSAFFHGAYLTGSYMLKGKQRKYYDYWGIFSPLANVEKGGSWELLARFSYANANHEGGSSPLHAIRFGASTVSTLGLNWYPNGNLLIGLNYNYTWLDKYARARGLLVPIASNPNGALSFHTLQCRVQYIF